MSSRRFTAEEVLSQLMNWDSDVEEEISEMEDPSEPDNNAIDDPDCQFSHNEEDSEDDSAGVPSSDENQETQQLSSTEGTWTSKDELGNMKFLYILGIGNKIYLVRVETLVEEHITP
ncbi:hypothetical protein MHYP_G00113170 [Metynnis hypsauchen]